MSLEALSNQIGQALLEDNLVSTDALALANRESATTGVPVPVHLVASGQVRSIDMLRTVADGLGIEFFDATEARPPEPAAVQRVPGDLARKERVLPIRIDGGRLVVATDDPMDSEKKGRVAKASNSEILFALAERKPLQALITDAYAAQPAPVAAPPPSGAAVTSHAETAEVGFHINELLELLIDVGGSDLHLTAGSPPKIRLHGDLRPVEGYEKMMPAALRSLIYSILTSRQREILEEKLELDASHPVPGKGRFRVNVFFQRGSIGAVMRAIPNRIVSLETLGMPPVVSEMADLPRGLVLVTGATGSGKTTTLASLIDEINTNRSVHIMTVEDPIEFIHHHKQAIVNQREVGADTGSFAAALRHALRQDPDVILVGELRDLETMATALTAAETGHLVFATLHTQDAPGSVERIIDVFPPHQQQQVRVQLAEALQGVVTQQLLPTVDGKGRIPAVEVMVAIPAIRNLIREGKVHQIRSTMQAGGRHGMQTMDHSLAQLVRTGRVDLKIATERAQNIDEFMNLVGGNR